MGKKGKGDPSAAKAAQKAAKRAKQESKAAKTEAKRSKGKGSETKAAPNQKGKSANKKGSQGRGGIAAEDDEDLDTILKRFREEWQSEHKTTEERVGQAPSRRANATLTPCPHGTDLYLFGGEYFDGDRVVFYADLFRYTPASASQGAALDSDEEDAAADSTGPVDRGVWRCYSSPNQPGPRSAHQVAATAANGGQLWLFGGEFAGMKMTSFHHYRDVSGWKREKEKKALTSFPAVDFPHCCQAMGAN